jgi:hypothetical protein
VSLSVALPNRKGRIRIEKDFTDEWAMVIRAVKGSGLDEVYGIVTAEE